MASTIVVACEYRTGAIGHNGQLYHTMRADMRHFAETTKGGVVIMGRKTWDSIPPHRRPLAGRFNVVLTRSGMMCESDRVAVCGSMEQVADVLASPLAEPYCSKGVFVIGGGDIYRLFLESRLVKSIIATVFVPNAGVVVPASSYDTTFPLDEVVETYGFRRTNTRDGTLGRFLDSDERFSAYVLEFHASTDPLL